MSLYERLCAIAGAYPETQPVGACVNTAFKARKKNFAFIGEKPELTRVMVKLAASLPQAQALAEQHPTVCKAGTGGWVTLNIPHDFEIDEGQLVAWIDESFRTLAPKTLVKQLD